MTQADDLAAEDRQRIRARREELIERFENAYRLGQRPVLDEYLPAEPEERRAVLVELVHADLEMRLKAGESARAGQYLERYSELADSDDAAALIGAEFEFRRRREPELTAEECYGAYPRFREALAKRKPVDSQEEHDEYATVTGSPAAFRTQAPSPGPATSAGKPSDSDGNVTASGARSMTFRTQSFETPEGLKQKLASDQDDEPMPVVPGYEILGVLGRGGMGVVYKARQVKLQRLVALKMILAGSHAGRDEVARFRTEAEAIARLQHPNIVQVYEIGEHEGKPFLCLELCTGGSLSAKLKEAPLPFDEAARMMEILARAMQTAHEKNVIHRDLKPANILLSVVSSPLSVAKTDGSRQPFFATDNGQRTTDKTDNGQRTIPKITDFGLAKKSDEATQTISGAVMGTPSYMAPEQAGGKNREVGPLTDVYALGAILYQLLTGRPPFKAATPLETMAQVIDNEPVPPTHLQPKTPRDLETICLKCLQKDSLKRYGSALALAEDLRRFLDGVPIHARPTPAWERLFKWGRRKPVAAALVAVTLLAAVAGVAAVSFFVRNQSQRAELLEQELKRTREQDEVREQGNRLLLQARQYEAEGKWPEAQAELSRAEGSLASQTDPVSEELRAEVRQRLKLVEDRVNAHKRRNDFQEPYNDALFHQTGFTREELADNQSKTRAAVQKALFIYGLDVPSKNSQDAIARLQRDRPYLDATEHAELTRRCYELLLIWAEVESTPPAGVKEPPERSRQRAEEALTLLTRAEQVGKMGGLDTRTYHVLKARCQAQREGRTIDPDALDREITVERTSAMDWFLTALAIYRSGRRSEQGTEACLKALRLDEKRFWARYLLALFHMGSRRWLEGQAELTVCVNQRPDFAWPRLLRGFAASELSFRQTSAVLATALYKAADEDFVTAMAKDTSKKVRYVGLTNRGVLNIRWKRWDEAEDYLGQALKEKPDGYQAYVNLAQALRGQGKWEQAAAALTRGIELVPSSGEYYWSRAKIQLDRKKPALARRDFEKAIELAPADRTTDWQVDSLVELGRLMHEEKRYAEALAFYDRALRLRPSSVLVHRLKSKPLVALNRDGEAGAELDRFLAAAARVPADVYFERGLLHAEAKQYGDAIEMYTLALKKDPKNSETRCQRGWTYLVMDAPRLALDDFNHCLHDDPGNAHALTGRGNVKIRQNDIEGALADARDAEKVGKLTDQLLYNLARIYAQVAARLRSEPGSGARTDRAAQKRIQLYEERSCECLRRALEQLSEAKRSTFWRKQVEPDPGLAGIRRTKLYGQLAASYSKSVYPK